MITVDTTDQAMIDQCVDDLEKLIDLVDVRVSINAYQDIPEGRTAIAQTWSADMITGANLVIAERKLCLKRRFAKELVVDEDTDRWAILDAVRGDSKYARDRGEIDLDLGGLTGLDLEHVDVRRKSEPRHANGVLAGSKGNDILKGGLSDKLTVEKKLGAFGRTDDFDAARTTWRCGGRRRYRWGGGRWSR